MSLYPGWTLDLIKKCTCTYTVHVNLIIHVVYYVQYIPVILLYHYAIAWTIVSTKDLVD